MDLSSFIGWLSALFPLHPVYWLYCDVRIQIYAAHSGAFSGSTTCFLDYDSFRNLPLIHYPLLSDRCDNPKEDCSILFPILHLSGFRIQNMSGFYSSGESTSWFCDLSKYPMLWFITYHCVLNCGTYSIVTVLLRNQLFRVAFTYLSSSFCPPNDYRSGCSKNMGETGGCLPSWSHPAKLLFEAAPLRRVLWELSGNSNLSPLVSKLV